MVLPTEPVKSGAASPALTGFTLQLGTAVGKVKPVKAGLAAPLLTGSVERTILPLEP